MWSPEGETRQRRVPLHFSLLEAPQNGGGGGRWGVAVESQGPPPLQDGEGAGKESRGSLAYEHGGEG